ncbi:MAG: ComEC/Rec2 family competence protein [Trueperaceae bacterium]|nr:ComEC/Rec2 family competence protein [Trueperaceae bacterium]
MTGTFVPWPLPLAVGAVLGVVVTAPLGPGATWVVVAGLAAAGTLAWRRCGWRWPHVVAHAGIVGLAPFLPVVALAAAVGAARMQAWQAGPSERQRAVLAAEYAGAEHEWRGRSDGEFLSTTAPVAARLAIVMPRGAAVPVGDVMLVGTAEPAPGKRNPGGFDYASHLARRGVAGQLFVRGAVAPTDSTFRLIDRLAAGVGAGLPEPAAGLMLALTLGKREDLGGLRETFGAAGMAHLLALSGLHVGILLLALGRSLSRLPTARLPVLAAATLGFVLLVGPSPSVVRAATMSLAALAATALGSGRAHAWATLGLAALLGTLSAPQMVLDLGFQLSYLAVAGMLVFLPPWTKALTGPGLGGRSLGGGAPTRSRGRLARLGGALVNGGLVSVAAQLPTLSLVAGTFGGVPVASPLVNVVAVPLAGLLVPLGFLAAAAGLVATPLAALVNHVTGPLAGALIGAAELGARLPFAVWGEIGSVGHVAWVGACVGMAAWAHGRLRAAQALAVVLLCGGATVALTPRHGVPDVWFLDVGQGDAALIRLPGGTGVLVDGGGTPFSDYDVGKRVVLPALRALGVRRLDAVVSTHPDADHLEGLLTVLGAMPVGLLVAGPPVPDNALDVALRELAAARNVEVHEAWRGESLVVGRAGRVVLDVLNPARGPDPPAGNDASVALVLRLDGVARAVFLGDIGVAVEPELPVPPVDVLMVGHHGSRGSTGEGLVRAASPSLAVISVGRNSYGHPTAEVVDRLAAHGVTVLTTQERGAVRVGLRGSTTWSTMVGP